MKRRKYFATGVALLCVCSMLLSGCSAVQSPYATPKPTTKPTQTEIPQPTVSPTDRPTNPTLVTDEEILKTYFGITFEEEDGKKANLVQASSSSTACSFGDVFWYVTLNTDNALDLGNVKIYADITAYDTMGSEMKSGIVKNINSSGLEDGYGQGFSAKYPGKYYVTYTIDTTEYEQDYKTIKLEAETREYIVSKVYEIEKVDAIVSVEDDFYFIDPELSPIYASKEYQIATPNGEDIFDIFSEDIYQTSKVKLSVPAISTPRDKSYSYEIDIVGKVGSGIVSDSDIKSKYFNVILQNGSRHIIPKEDEELIKKTYQLIDKYPTETNGNIDYAYWTSYVVASDAFEDMTKAQQALFDLYPTYVAVRDNIRTSSTEYQKTIQPMIDKREFMYRMNYDKNRVQYGEQLIELVEAFENKITDNSDELVELVAFFTEISNQPVYIKNAESYKDSDLAFATKYAFGNMTTNQDTDATNGFANKYIKISEDENNPGAYIFASETTAIVNLAILGTKSKFDMYVSAGNTLVSILRADTASAVAHGAIFNAYYASLQPAGLPEEMLDVKETIDRYIITANASDALKDGNTIDHKVAMALGYVREFVKDSYTDLFDFQATKEVYATYTNSMKDIDSYIYRYNSYIDLLEKEDLTVYVGGECGFTYGYMEELLAYDFQTLVGNSAKDLATDDKKTDLFESSNSENAGYIIMHCPIVYVDEAVARFSFWVKSLINLESDAKERQHDIVYETISAMGNEMLIATTNVYEGNAGYSSTGYYTASLAKYHSKVEFYVAKMKSLFDEEFPWHKMTLESFDDYSSQAFDDAMKMLKSDYIAMDREWLEDYLADNDVASIEKVFENQTN